MSINILCYTVASVIMVLLATGHVSRIYKRGKLIEKYEAYMDNYPGYEVAGVAGSNTVWDHFTSNELLVLLKMNRISKRQYYNAYKQKLIN